MDVNCITCPACGKESQDFVEILVDFNVPGSIRICFACRRKWSRVRRMQSARGEIAMSAQEFVGRAVVSRFVQSLGEMEVVAWLRALEEPRP